MHSMYLITGATGGLGKAFAAEVASRGWDVFLTDIDDARLGMLASSLARAYGVEARHQAVNLIEASSRAALLDRIQREGLRLRGLINVAGLDHEGLFMDRKSEEISTIVRLNIEATLLLTHALLRHRDHGMPFRIINVSSLGAFFAMPVKATYAASKRFLLDFSLALGNELRDENVTVTALCPAGMPTRPDVVEAIEAQGLMGQLTTENVGSVAHQTVEAAIRGRAVVVPGMLNRMLLVLSGLMPRAGIVELIGKRWRAAHQNRAASQLAGETAG
jgi:uncharacterized protein